VTLCAPRGGYGRKKVGERGRFYLGLRNMSQFRTKPRTKSRCQNPKRNVAYPTQNAGRYTQKKKPTEVYEVPREYSVKGLQADEKGTSTRRGTATKRKKKALENGTPRKGSNGADTKTKGLCRTW